MSHDFIDEMLDKARSGELRSPVSELLGMHLEQYGRGEAVFEMTTGDELRNSLGQIPPGIATALADRAIAVASTSILNDDEVRHLSITQVDLFARYMRPLCADEVDSLRAKAKVVRADARLVWTEAEVLADGELVARFAATAVRVAQHPEPPQQ